MNSRPSPDRLTETQDDWPRTQIRLRPDIHHELEQIKKATGRSLNSLVNEACSQMTAMASATGGAAKIARERKRLPRRTDPGRAALAYILGYFGQAASARRMWPWSGRFTVKAGDPAHLALAGALLADEIDRIGERKWATSAARPSGAR
jgi:hypothetical protein